MSEIKGQILGVVLVLAIFGAIGTVLVTAFTDNAKKVAENIATDTKPEYDASKSTITKKQFKNTDLFEDVELLTF